VSTNPAAPLVAEEVATFRRPGRALIGWMPPERGAIALAGGRQEGVQNQDLIERVEAARAVVAEREPGIDQDGMIDATDPALATIVERLRQQPDTGAFWEEGWTVRVGDLTRVCSLQQSVASQQAGDRVSEVDPDDLVSIAAVTLPAPSTGPSSASQWQSCPHSSKSRAITDATSSGTVTTAPSVSSRAA
jgi:hypothetical protein